MKGGVYIHGRMLFVSGLSAEQPFTDPFIYVSRLAAPTILTLCALQECSFRLGLIQKVNHCDHQVACGQAMDFDLLCVKLIWH